MNTDKMSDTEILKKVEEWLENKLAINSEPDHGKLKEVIIRCRVTVPSTMVDKETDPDYTPRYSGQDMAEYSGQQANRDGRLVSAENLQEQIAIWKGLAKPADCPYMDEGTLGYQKGGEIPPIFRKEMK